MDMEQLNKSQAVDTSVIGFTYTDFMLLCNKGGLDSAKVAKMKEEMIEAYVNKRFPGKIYQMKNASGYKKEKWRAKSAREKIDISGKKEYVYAKLYEHYKNQETGAYTLQDVFDLLMEDKVNLRNRSPKTVIADRSKFKTVGEGLKNALIGDITAEDIQRWIVGEFLATNPRECHLRKALSIMSQCFEYAIRKRLCESNPVERVYISDYLKSCRPDDLDADEEQFSEEEVKMLVEDGFAHSNNPRALMEISSSDSGMRRAELCALEWDDVDFDTMMIHVHREQIDEKNGNTAFLSTTHYTKDQRIRPRNGRYIPILDNMKEALMLAKQIPGVSKFVFHDPYTDGMISTNSYSQYLKRRCKALGISATNNHAFRKAFNTKLIRLGFSPDERAYIMGHSVETNERDYSLTDGRRAKEIRDKMLSKMRTGLEEKSCVVTFPRGFEPPTSRLGGARSIQSNYQNG